MSRMRVVYMDPNHGSQAQQANLDRGSPSPAWGFGPRRARILRGRGNSRPYRQKDLGAFWTVG